jgi:hypothetical protein
MAVTDVEELFLLLSAHSYPTEPSLSEGLAAALAEHVITRVAGLSAAKQGLLRDMRGAVEGGADQLTWTERDCHTMKIDMTTMDPERMKKVWFHAHALAHVFYLLSLSVSLSHLS